MLFDVCKYSIKNMTSEQSTTSNKKLVLQKCNQLLVQVPYSIINYILLNQFCTVQILVLEFPNWGGFIQNLLTSATVSTAACQNCMEIIKNLGYVPVYYK